MTPYDDQRTKKPNLQAAELGESAGLLLSVPLQSVDDGREPVRLPIASGCQ